MGGLRVATIFYGSLWLASAAPAGCTRSRTATEPPAADSAAGSEVASDDPVVCERVEVPGQGRIRKRVCRRESEIRAEREASQAGVRGARPVPPPMPEFGSGM
ncbi:MAG TPA: hypothetical protein VK509_06905 [Polyangiales bacterium]|nr:hypothetical protein [Polyangiales bacterium]